MEICCVNFLCFHTLPQIQCSVDYFLHHGLGDPPAMELLHDGDHGEFPSVGVGQSLGVAGTCLVGGLLAG